MQSSMTISGTDAHYRPVRFDRYQTYTGSESQHSEPPASPAAQANHCPDCNLGGQMITAEKAATICQCSRRLIYRWVEEGSLHFRELPDGTVLVCGVRLAAKLEQLEDATGYLSR